MNRIYGALAARLQRGTATLLLMAILPMAATAAPPRPSTLPQRTVLVVGDSLSAGYGLANGQGWVALTAKKMATSSPGWGLVNASISGDTSAGGLARIDRELRLHHPSVLVLELGANDGLQGLDTKQMRGNLERIVQRAQARGARVLIVGMKMPPNMGARYTHDFEAVFADLAKQYRTSYLPFLLAPVAAQRSNFQADNLHPVAAVQPKLRDYVWTRLGPLLSATTKPASSPTLAPKNAARARAANGSGG